jgi:hypothetical protein
MKLFTILRFAGIGLVAWPLVGYASTGTFICTATTTPCHSDSCKTTTPSWGALNCTYNPNPRANTWHCTRTGTAKPNSVTCTSDGSPVPDILPALNSYSTLDGSPQPNQGGLAAWSYTLDPVTAAKAPLPPTPGYVYQLWDSLAPNSCSENRTVDTDNCQQTQGSPAGQSDCVFTCVGIPTG